MSKPIVPQTDPASQTPRRLTASNSPALRYVKTYYNSKIYRAFLNDVNENGLLSAIDWFVRTYVSEDFRAKVRAALAPTPAHEPKVIPAREYKCPSCSQTGDGYIQPDAPNYWNCPFCHTMFRMLPSVDGIKPSELAVNVPTPAPERLAAALSVPKPLPYSATKSAELMNHYILLALRESGLSINNDMYAELDDLLLPVFKEIFGRMNQLESRIAALESDEGGAK